MTVKALLFAGAEQPSTWEVSAVKAFDHAGSCPACHLDERSVAVDAFDFGHLRVMRRAGLVLAILLVGLVAVPRGLATRSVTCPAFTGPAWTLTGKYALPGRATKRTGAQYLVLPAGIGCSAATGLAKKVAGAPLAKRAPNVFVRMTGGPAGYACQGKPDSNGHAWMGTCVAANRKAYFYWTVKLT